MDEARTKRIQKLLERLGRAIRSSVVDSDEVNDCLAQLHSDGWDAVMFLEASLLCRQGDDHEPQDDELRIHVGTTHREAEYLIDSTDARWLAAIGISPTRHRSHPNRALPPLDQPHPPTNDDG